MRELQRLAERQHGLFTRHQWLAAGLTQRQRQYRRSTGGVQVVHRGVYSFSGTPRSFERDVTAACLATGGVASHRCAAYLWGMRRFERKAVEVLVVRGHTPRLSGIAVRRTDRLDRLDHTMLGVIPITTRARTLLDLATVTPDLVESALNGVLLRHPAELGRLDRLLRRTGAGRDGSRLLRHLVDLHLAGRRPTESVLEDDFLALVLRYGLPEPAPQYEVGNHRLDFAYPPLVCGFELDGLAGHAEKADIQRNCDKGNELLDWRVLHFTWDDVHGRPGYVAARVARELRRRAAA